MAAGARAPPPPSRRCPRAAHARCGLRRGPSAPPAMFAELNELLGASPQRPEPGKFTLLRDTRTDGSFLVHHFLSFYLRAGCKVCFVALLQSFSHYSIVAQKLVSLWAWVHHCSSREFLL
ncbi:elongator complex protein 6-like, partial [Empidonax traillii]|uniref:elongator complex protein 6-like n=1 Tax=Empidonax traillii TaxID=164674 RepID=UPI000FFD08AD